MNEAELKRSLRQLFNEGWFVSEISDDFIQEMCGHAEDPPSDEIKERFLLNFRVRLQEAMMQQAGKDGALKHELSGELGRKSSRPQRRRKL